MGYKYMRVLQINSVCGIGSTGRIATDIHKLLIEQGHESYIAYGRGEAVNCDNAIKIGSDLDIYKHFMLTRVLDRHGFGSKKATREFIKKIIDINPDIIHLHNVHGYYINIEELFKYLKEANKPVVWTLHDCWAFTGHCAYFDYIGCQKWINGCNNCPQKKGYPSSYIVDNSTNNYAIKKELFTSINDLTIVTPSVWLKNLVQQSFLKEYSIRVIYNGINLDIFKPTISNFRNKYNLSDKFIILGVANIWDERKGLKFFIELSKVLEQDEIIVLVGLTKKQISKLPINIIGINKTNDIYELAEIYSNSDVFVNTTLDEVLGLTNLEALACGTPVITFNSGGSPECIDINTGIVVDKGNIIDVRNAITTIRNRKIDKDILVSRVKDNFNKNDKYSEYLILYNSLMNK